MLKGVDTAADEPPLMAGDGASALARQCADRGGARHVHRQCALGERPTEQRQRAERHRVAQHRSDRAAGGDEQEGGGCEALNACLW